jgi:hypothetical protein
MGSEAAAVVVWVCAALFATSVGADTWKRGAGVTVVTVDENFSVGVTAEGGWGLQDGGVSVWCTQPLTRTSTATALHAPSACMPTKLQGMQRAILLAARHGNNS